MFFFAKLSLKLDFTFKLHFIGNKIILILKEILVNQMQLRTGFIIYFFPKAQKLFPQKDYILHQDNDPKILKLMSN